MARARQYLPGNATEQGTAGFYGSAVTLYNASVALCDFAGVCLEKKEVYKGGSKQKAYIQSGHFRVNMLLSRERS